MRAEVDAGEAEAIALALELSADFLLIDDRAGRRAAVHVGLKIVGTLGILVEAKSRGTILAVAPIVESLKQRIGFRVHPETLRGVLVAIGEA